MPRCCDASTDSSIRNLCSVDTGGEGEMDITRPDSSVLQLAVELACRAPSLHNSQPWRWEHSGGELKLFGDRTRLLPAADPTGRQLHISCGAALHHLSVGLLGLRWTTDIRYERRAISPDLLATIGFRR